MAMSFSLLENTVRTGVLVLLFLSVQWLMTEAKVSVNLNCKATIGDMLASF